MDLESLGRHLLEFTTTLAEDPRVHVAGSYKPEDSRYYPLQSLRSLAPDDSGAFSIQFVSLAVPVSQEIAIPTCSSRGFVGGVGLGRARVRVGRM